MKNLALVLVSSVMLTGCFKVIPTKPEFPTPPEQLLELCPNLVVVPEDTTQLSVVLEKVTINYAEYHLCAARHEQLVNWYNEVKKINQELE